jgi:predicted Zn-dependent protease with MMP-like domain
MTYEEFVDFVEYIVANEVPAELLEELNGGVQTSEQLKRDTDEKNFLVFGHYIRDNLGKRVMLYYGTFLHFLGDKSEEKWEREVLKVIKHELRHHIEARAGQEDLAKLERWEKEQRRSKRKKE